MGFNWINSVEAEVEAAGIVIHFNPEKEEFVLEQGGGKFTFTREK